jgi:hypothetical protein
MILQHALKGITGLTDAQARRMLLSDGLTCEWWRRKGTISPPEVTEKLTNRNLRWHLDRYSHIDPRTGCPFHEGTPFISLTAGTFDHDRTQRRNIRLPAHETAVLFATKSFAQPGHVFYGYVMVLPNPAVELEEFAEDVRDFHTYTRFSPYRRQGEVTAKIHVPSVRLHRVERYEPSPRSAARCSDVWFNPNFQPPEDHANLRRAL